MAADVYIGIGSNQGERETNIRKALDMAASDSDISLRRVSSLIETPPAGGPDQPPFLNGAAALYTDLKPRELLHRLQGIERKLKRRRNPNGVVWGPRAIDLDILLYDQLRIESDDLRLPHPMTHERLFVLRPLAEIAPALVHPALNLTVSQMLAELEKRAALGPPDKPCYIAVAGPIGAGKTTLTLQLAGRLRLAPYQELARPNPLLSPFYADRRSYALSAQLWFLLERAGQMSGAKACANGRFATDYIFEQDLVFAHLNLNPEEMKIYRAAREIAIADPPAPDLVIYLSADAEFLFGRVMKRGRTGEERMERRYLASLCRAYEKMFDEYDAAPILRIEANAHEIDYLSDRAAFRRVLKKAVQYLPEERWGL